ncbi:MAG: VWA domain-containing protein [Alphaproteobacteria bacterium]|nr:VWA domain-containing protein [Alphaproteobacteria bacterium]
MMKLLAAAFSFVLTFLLLPAAIHAEDSGSRVILVLDASGSMRAKINGKAKIDIAKEVVGKIVGAWNPKDELGLVVYGHRKKGECSDIETVKEPGPLNAADYMAAVNAIQPKGQTPLTQAVKQAAEALQYTEKKATVILVSDGIETCNADPCAVAAELAKAGVELKVHTVGFGLDDQGAVAQLKCLADKTGGTFTVANNADDLLKALTKTVQAAPPPAAPKLQFNVTGHATLAGGVEIPKPFSPPNWVFKKPDAADGTQGEMVDSTHADQLKFQLAPQDYVLRLEAGVAFAEQPFTLEQGKTVELKPVLNAGIVNFSAMIDEKTKLTDTGAAWEVLTPDGNDVETEYGATRGFLLNAGDYLLRLSLGDTKVETPFSVKAGEIRDQVINFGSGELVVQAVFAEGGPAMDKGMAFEVAKPVEGADKPQWINTAYDAKSTFTLPAGKYIVDVTLGLAHAEQEVEVKTGQQTALTLNAKAGYIAATAQGATSYVVNDGKEDLDGKHKWLTTTYDPALNIAANEGSYQVQAFKGDTLLGEKLVDVKAGQRMAVTLP